CVRVSLSRNFHHRTAQDRRPVRRAGGQGIIAGTFGTFDGTPRNVPARRSIYARLAAAVARTTRHRQSTSLRRNLAVPSLAQPRNAALSIRSPRRTSVRRGLHTNLMEAEGESAVISASQGRTRRRSGLPDRRMQLADRSGDRTAPCSGHWPTHGGAGPEVRPG